jgi:hypothetical protein
MAQENQDHDKDDNDNDDDNDNNNSEFIDIDDLIDPRLKLSTTQLGLQRLEGVSDSYQPGTLPPRLYQSNPFVQQTEPTETGEIQYELSAKEVPATAQEMQQIEEDEADEEALSLAIETVLATTRAARKRIATPKVVDNAAQARDAKKAKTGGHGGLNRGGRGGSGWKV